MSYYLTSTISTIVDRPVESEWITLEIKNPNIDEFNTESWVAWSTGYGDYDSDTWQWYFYTYKIEIDDVHIEGYKDDAQQLYCVSYVSYRIKFTGNKQWSSGAKTWFLEVSCGHAYIYPEDVDKLTFNDYDHPPSTWTTKTHSWGTFNPYGSEKIGVLIAAYFYSSVKGVAISELSFSF